MKNIISDVGGYLLFLLFMLVCAPIIMVYGGLIAIPRFYMYVSSKVHDQEPRKYYF